MNNQKKKIKLECDGNEPIDDNEKTAIYLENYELRKSIETLKVEQSEMESRSIKEHTRELELKDEMLKTKETETNDLQRDLLSKYSDIERLKESLSTEKREKLNVSKELLDQRNQTVKEQKEVQKCKDILERNNLLFSPNEIAKKYNLKEFDITLLEELNSQNFHRTEKEYFIKRYLIEDNRFSSRRAEHIYKDLKERGIIEESRYQNEMDTYIKLTTSMEEAILELF